MHDTLLEQLVRRDRAVVVVSLAVISTLAWLYIVRLAAAMQMDGMDMTGFRMVPSGLSMMMAPASHPWSIIEFALMFSMWTVMMVGMMTPSVGPLLLLYARVGRQAANRQQPIAATGWFAAGYLLAWTGFAFAATLLQRLLELTALLTPMMVSASRLFTATVLIVAGVYQWLPIKNRCLNQCRSPFSFIQRCGGFRREPGGAVRLGLRHGLYCIGCCWVLMLLLFAGGVMALPWIAALTIVVLVEKVAPGGPTIARVAGVLLAGVGLWSIR